MEENNCKFVSSRGILKSCNVKSNNPSSCITFFDINSYNLNNLYEGCTIYVCTRAIHHFIHLLNSINYRFILVSGDTDYTLTDELLYEFKVLIDSPKLIKWYSQNCTASHEKVFRMPIGLDYHSKQELTEYILPVIHENMLLEIVKNSKPFYERIIKAHANYHFRLEYNNSDRRDALNQINRDLVYYAPERTERFYTYEEQSKYAFIISPHGNGLDCHRTYEALVLGCIPIVKKCIIYDMLDDLPVLIVDEWSDITQELLDKTIEEFKNRVFNYDKLTLKYWMDKIKS